MESDSSEDRFKSLCELLVKRGFANTLVYSDKSRAAAFDFTKDGEEARRLLRKMFNIPANNPMSLNATDIADLVMVLLLTPPSNEVR